MWIHIVIFIAFCGLFVQAKGFLSKSGTYLAGKLPSYLKITEKQVQMFLWTVFIGNVAGSILTGVVYLNGNQNLSALKRQQDPYAEELYVTDGTNKEKIQVEVRTEPYTDAEKQEMLDEALKNLDKEILGENKSLERVEYPLNLPTEIPDTGILIQWNTDQPLLLDWEGQIGEAVPQEGVRVHLEAELILDEYRRNYEAEVHVFPEKIPEEEQFVKSIQKELDHQNEKEGTYLNLPMELNGKKLIWSKANQQMGLWVAGMAIIIGILLAWCEKSRRDEEKEKQKKEMEIDYPGILNKMILLMQAGMSSRRAIQKVALDYRDGLEKGKKPRGAYEEILQIYRELEQGTPEEEAYRRMANRIDLLCYRTFATLLIQNLKKGSSYFISALKQECSAAFAERKSRAQILGEEAGTKLLIPMGCMLLIVLVIILVPSMMVLG